MFTCAGGSDMEQDYGLIRPSLIKQLRSILDQYPDDGQILKVCYPLLDILWLFYLILNCSGRLGGYCW